MNEIQRLKAVIKRRDAKILQLKGEVKSLRSTEDYLRDEVGRYQENREEFKQALMRFLNLDDHIRDVVREAL